MKGKKILIVDDDERNIFSLKAVLRSMGAKCISATNGEEGIQVLKMNPDCDLVLLDMMMPIMDGFEAAWLIKNNSSLKQIPVIAVTAKAMEGDMEKCLAAGCDDYISKPVDVDELISKLNNYL